SLLFRSAARALGSCLASPVGLLPSYKATLESCPVTCWLALRAVSASSVMPVKKTLAKGLLKASLLAAGLAADGLPSYMPAKGAALAPPRGTALLAMFPAALDDRGCAGGGVSLTVVPGEWPRLVGACSGPSGAFFGS